MIRLFVWGAIGLLLKELNANVNALCTSPTLTSTSPASRAMSVVGTLLVSSSNVELNPAVIVFTAVLSGEGWGYL